MPLPTADRLEILMVLAVAAEPEFREKALETLRGWDHVEVRRVMASPQTAPEVLRFAAQQLLPEREELREILLWNPSLPAESRQLLQAKPVPPFTTVETASRPLASLQLKAAIPPSPPGSAKEFQPKLDPASEPTSEDVTIELLAKLVAGAPGDPASAPRETPSEATKPDDDLTQKDRETLIEKIGRMTVAEKIKAALTGNLETRSLLIRDANKLISRAVLQSPRISETEAEGYAGAKNVSEEVLRLVAANRKFMKSYVVLRALVNNPRAPVDITMPLLARMNERDLKGLSQNRNVPDVIRSLAVKMIKQRQDALKPKLPGRH